MKHLIVNYKNALKRSNIVETIDFTEDDYILIHKVELLEKYVGIICPYVDINKLLLFDNRSKCLRYNKLIQDEIDYQNNEENNNSYFSIDFDDDQYIKCPLYLSDSENEN